MSMYAIRNLDPAILRHAKSRARAEGTSLDDVLRHYLASYAEHGHAQTKGGYARQATLTPEERTAAAKHAAAARWADRK